MMAFMPEAHTLFTVVHGMLSGKPGGRTHTAGSQMWSLQLATCLVWLTSAQHSLTSWSLANASAHYVA